MKIMHYTGKIVEVQSLTILKVKDGYLATGAVNGELLKVWFSKKPSERDAAQQIVHNYLSY